MTEGTGRSSQMPCRSKETTTASKTDTGKAETNRVKDIKERAVRRQRRKRRRRQLSRRKANCSGLSSAEQRTERKPSGRQGIQETQPRGAPEAVRHSKCRADRRAAKSAAPAENRDGQRSGYQGKPRRTESGGYRETATDKAAAIRNRDGQRSGGYQETAMDREAAAIRETVMDREAAIRETVTDREAAAIRETVTDREAAAIRKP